MKTRFLLALCGAALVAAPGLTAQDYRHDYNQSPGRYTRELSHADRRFFMKAAEGSANEVALSRLAVERAQDSRVREFARRMIRDHENLNSQLQALAGRRGVDLTEAVQKGQEEDVDSMARKSGADFDEDYLDAMIKGHKDTIDLFESTATDSRDPGIAELAGSALPTILEHYRHARDLARRGEDANPPRVPTPYAP